MRIFNSPENFREDIGKKTGFEKPSIKSIIRDKAMDTKHLKINLDLGLN